MPTPTTARVAEFAEDVYALSPKYRSQALAVADAFSFEELFVVVHSMRRWYNGQTMAGALEAHRRVVECCMDLNPQHAVGAYRGFKVASLVKFANALNVRPFDLLRIDS